MAKRSLSTRRPSVGKIHWSDVLERAKDIVESYDTGVTLRQLYYRLVSEGLIPNQQNAYKTLSSKTAQARREGWFPTLIDRTREIERFRTFSSPQESLEWLRDIYLRDRTEGQKWSIYIGVEKHGLTTQLVHWFGKYGIPVLALGGYSSQTFVDEVAADVQAQGRQSVLLYAGDFDPSGMDIDRDFIERGMCFDEVVRVALTADIVTEYDLPPMPGKETDSRSARFILEHGDLVQVELDALPPEKMRKLYQEAIDKYFDEKTWKKSCKRENKETAVLEKFTAEADMGEEERLTSLIGEVDEEDTLLTLSDALALRLDEVREQNGR